MHFEYGDFYFLFFKDEGHTIILSSHFLCAMSTWRLHLRFFAVGRLLKMKKTYIYIFQDFKLMDHCSAGVLLPDFLAKLGQTQHL